MRWTNSKANHLPKTRQIGFGIAFKITFTIAQSHLGPCLPHCQLELMVFSKHQLDNVVQLECLELASLKLEI